jgi:ribonuclease HI
VYVDGLCEPYNPKGIACYGYVIYRDSQKVFEDKGVVGQGEGMSNNVAEYTALWKALLKLYENNLTDEEVIVKSDSRLVVNQMKGYWDVHGGLYYRSCAKAKILKGLFDKISFVWVPREENSEADKLSRIAYEDYCRIKGIKPEYHIEKIQVFTFKKDTCMTCKWVIFSGPHIGCYKGYKYHGWLPKSFAMRSKCPDYLPKEKS